MAKFSDVTDDSSDIMMASSICSLIFDYTSEEALLNHLNFDHRTFNCLSRLIARSLATCWQVSMLFYGIRFIFLNKY